MTYRGGSESIYFHSGDAELIGILYGAAGDIPRPAAILLHGIPGSERNADIAYRLREMGWHVLSPSFRGAWGSGGDYDITCHPDDASAAIDFLLKPGADWQVDPLRIALIGYSLGSRAAIVAGHRDSRVGAVVSLAGIADFDELLLSDETFAYATHFLGGVTAQSLKAQWAKLGGADNPVKIVGQLRQPLLIAHGTQDEVVPYFMAPALHEAASGLATIATIEDADHTFTWHRAQLVEIVTSWLDRWAKGA
jgi:hypothetical protein